MSGVYRVQENLQDAIDSYNAGALAISDLKDLFDTQADEIDSIAEEYDESAENMPENLKYSQQAEELRERSSDLQTWAQSLRDVDWPDDDDSCTYGDASPCREDQDSPVHDQGSEDYDHDFENVADIDSAIEALESFPL